jgi:hypothetical protein
MKKNIKNITIIGRRWFQRTYGNTYHSVEVYVNGELIGRVEFAYGYGDHYLQTAHEILQDKGYYPKTGITLPSGMCRDYYGFTQDMHNHRNKFVISVTDVERKKDL